MTFFLWKCWCRTIMSTWRSISTNHVLVMKSTMIFIRLILTYMLSIILFHISYFGWNRWSRRFNYNVDSTRSLYLRTYVSFYDFIHFKLLRFVFAAETNDRVNPFIKWIQYVSHPCISLYNCYVCMFSSSYKFPAFSFKY